MYLESDSQGCCELCGGWAGLGLGRDTAGSCRAKCFLGRQTINGKWMSPSIVMEMVVLCVWIDVTNLSCLPTCGLRNDNNPAHLCSTESQYISFFNARLWPTPWQTLHLLEVPFLQLYTYLYTMHSNVDFGTDNDDKSCTMNNADSPSF